MGPRLVSRGKMAMIFALIQLALLQWGRDLLVAESDASMPFVNSRYWLQWGRDLLVAESAKYLGCNRGH